MHLKIIVRGGDKLDDENLPLFFTQPRFEWTGGDTAVTRDIH